jgi:hypothetical protein
MPQKKQKSTLSQLFSYMHNHVQTINNSKIFAGIMIITLNIASKFANFKLSKTLESYLKFTFSRQILIFAIAWMGTRDIYIATFITIIFSVVTDHLLHEDSPLFIMPESFKDYHISLLENDGLPDKVSDDDIKRAKAILEKANVLNNETDLTGYSLK